MLCLLQFWKKKIRKQITERDNVLSTQSYWILVAFPQLYFHRYSIVNNEINALCQCKSN